MPSVTLTILTGAHADKQFCFDVPGEHIVGRDPRCGMVIHDSRNPPQVSSRHCQINVDPPQIKVRDLDSTNGTRINGQVIGKRGEQNLGEKPLHHGDLLTLADVDLRVSVSPVQCSRCRAEPPEQQLYTLASGDAVCFDCYQQGQTGVLPANAVPDTNAGALEQLLTQAHTGKVDLLPLQNYVAVKQLGKGGMGAVYLAVHRVTRQQVALKIMLPHLAHDEGNRARLRREIETTLALKHPNIVRLYDHGHERDIFYFTLEFCEGGSVERYLARRGGILEIDEAIRLLLPVLDALEDAHSVPLTVSLPDGTKKLAKGIVHRDLKPGNLLLTSEGHDAVVKVADFGLAKAFDLAGMSKLTISGQGLGTPRFCPRQQFINARAVGPEVDIWSAVACLYHFLTGKTPREFPSRCDLFAELSKPPVPISQHRPDLPTALTQLIDDALLDMSDLTFRTVADFRQALLAVVKTG